LHVCNIAAGINEKNEKLKKEREIPFEEVVFYIETGNLLDVV